MKTPKNFRLDNSLIQKLKSYSEKSMIPETRIVEEALKQYLEKKEA